MGSALTVLLPLCLLKQLDALKYTSMLGLGGVLYCALFVVLRFLDGSYRPGGKFFSLIDASLQPSFGTQKGSMVRMFSILSQYCIYYQFCFNSFNIYIYIYVMTVSELECVFADRYD